ncbi:MAG: type II toxin-antitoxin system RelE family toxin [Streptosporangiaceae bacterium]
MCCLKVRPGGHRVHQRAPARQPRRLGSSLHGPLTGLYGAHVGDYRVEYDVDDDAWTVEVVRVAHRADIYAIT